MHICTNSLHLMRRLEGDRTPGTLQSFSFQMGKKTLNQKTNTPEFIQTFFVVVFLSHNSSFPSLFLLNFITERKQNQNHIKCRLWSQNSCCCRCFLSFKGMKNTFPL